MVMRERCAKNHAMRLLVVDDHSLIREAMRHVVQSLAESVTVLTAADCDAGYAIAEREHDLELLLLDFNMRGLSGVPAIKAWRQAHPTLPVVVLSSADDRATVLAAMAAGAAGFIPKASSNEVMVSALRLVLAGGKYLPAEVLACGDGGPAGTAAAVTLVAGQRHIQAPQPQLTAHRFAHGRVVVNHQHTAALQRVGRTAVRGLRWRGAGV